MKFISVTRRWRAGGYEVPNQYLDVPDDVLDPAGSWLNKKEFDQRYRHLAARSIKNFKKFEDHTPQEVIEAGPKI